jgi:hypothetical protein
MNKRNRFLSYKVKGFEKSIGHEPDQVLSRSFQENRIDPAMTFELPDQIVTVRFNAADLGWIVSANEKDSGLRHSFSFALLETHLADLLRHETHHEDDDGCGEKKGAHIGEATPEDKGVEVVEQPHQKKKDAYREENP